MAVCFRQLPRTRCAIDTDPKQINGPWADGYTLDRHTVSSTFIGYNEFGHPEYDTERTALGEMVYRAKYRQDQSAVASIAETVAAFVRELGIQVDVVVPIPPSKQRLRQPLIEMARAVSQQLGIPLDAASLQKNKGTPRMKDVGDYGERVALLKDAMEATSDVSGKAVLLLDDLYQSGASMRVAAEAIQEAGAASVYCIALTRTRN